MTWRRANASGLLLLALLPVAACKPKKGPGGTASADTSALTGVPMNVLPPVAETATAPAPPVDPLKPADRALVDRTKDAVRVLDELARKGLLSDPGNPGAGDAVGRCAAVESDRTQLEALPDGDGEFKKLSVETQRLCSFEIPIIACNQALRQASLSPSQASHRLVCNFAQKDFAKARAAKPNDRRVFELGQRLAQSCR